MFEKKVVFRFSGVDRFPLFERVLQLDMKFAEILDFDTFLPQDNDQ